MNDASDYEYRYESVTVDVVAYHRNLGLRYEWQDGDELNVRIDDSGSIVTVEGNRSGLTSLARHLLGLAHAETPDGRHLDFDEYRFPLDSAPSKALRIELVDN